ncbi:MAG TPA: LysM peptidoglycan-binding domain-containing protein, partial [Campylobacterales bacterium]|nr:LysM peptidoglycan-binding domain-containing protein [Campylobacterales bacterium]
KFANAIIQDVSNKKVSIIEENTNFLIIKVNNGDNLSILAQRYYNDRSKYKIIYEANKDKINSKYEIYPGSKLLIPKI